MHGIRLPAVDIFQEDKLPERVRMTGEGFGGYSALALSGAAKRQRLKPH